MRMETKWVLGPEDGPSTPEVPVVITRREPEPPRDEKDPVSSEPAAEKHP